MNQLRRCVVTFLLLGLSACSVTPNTPSTLDPQGPAAARIAELWWVMLALGSATFLLVIALMVAALLRRRRGTSATAPASKGGDTGRNWPILGGIVLPIVVISIAFGYSIYTLAVVENPPGQTAVRLQVVGRRWWWEVKYSDQGFITANEIHMPVGVPVQIQLETADVIHSLWIPELHGKLDLIPNRVNTVILQGDHVGVYRGECAEFCGLQHAHMGLMVVVQTKEDYDAWVSAQSNPAPSPTDETTQRGQQVFMESGCVFCHTVRGLDDKAIDRSGVDLGPDLTHLFSRLTIAGATLAANRENLSEWILDTQHIKQGSLMPDTPLNDPDLQALLDYLETLH